MLLLHGGREARLGEAVLLLLGRRRRQRGGLGLIWLGMLLLLTKGLLQARLLQAGKLLLLVLLVSLNVRQRVGLLGLLMMSLGLWLSEQALMLLLVWDSRQDPLLLHDDWLLLRQHLG